MKIREAKAGDEAELVNLFTTLDRETRFMLMEPGERKTTIERRAKLIEEFAQSNSRVLCI